MPGSNPDDERNGKSPLVKMGVVSALGFEFVGIVVGAFLLGSWIDQRFGVDPWGILASMAAGMIAAGWHVYLIAKRFLVDSED